MPNYHFWDLQKFSPIAQRWWDLQRKSQASCSEVAENLGVDGIKLHNAANDAYAEILLFLRLLTMTEEKFDHWRAGGAGLDSVDMSWVDPKILLENQPFAQRCGRSGEGHGQQP